MNLARFLEKYRTDIIAIIIAAILILAGLIIPNFMPDKLPPTIPALEDATWIKTIVSVLLIGMGILCFLWLVVIHHFILHKSKKDYMY